MAVEKRTKEITKFLVSEYGSLINIADYKGNRLTHFAGLPTEFNLLVSDGGSRLDVRNNIGVSPLCTLLKRKARLGNEVDKRTDTIRKMLKLSLVWHRVVIKWKTRCCTTSRGLVKRQVLISVSYRYSCRKRLSRQHPEFKRTNAVVSVLYCR